MNTLKNLIRGFRLWIKKYYRVLLPLLLFLTWIPGFILAAGVWDVALVSFLSLGLIVIIAVVSAVIAAGVSERIGVHDVFVFYYVSFGLMILLLWLTTGIGLSFPTVALWQPRFEGFFLWFFVSGGLLWWGKSA